LTAETLNHTLIGNSATRECVPVPGEAVVDAAAMFRLLIACGLRLGNRFVMPAMQRSWCADGQPTAFLTDCYCLRTKAETA
jgi:hypothetical protein